MNDFLAPPDLRVLGPRATLALVAAIDPTILPDGAIVLCQENGENYLLDKTSTLALASPYVLATASGIGRWIQDVTQAVFTGNEAVTLDDSTFAVYTGPVAAIAFTKAVGGHLEQRVKSYLIPANGATAVTFSNDLNVNIISAYDPIEEYLVAVTFFSGRVVGSARVVTNTP